MENRRKELIQEYKERKPLGGVYQITNRETGKYIVCPAPNLQAARNRFDFSVATNSCVHFELQEEWKEFGSKAFSFEVLEELEMKPEQTDKEFQKDLETLAELWREKLEAAQGA